MAYVDQAFSIFEEDIIMETSYSINNVLPMKEVALAVSLFVFGLIEMILDSFMTYNRIGDDRGHRIFFVILGVVLFIPRFYYTRIAYYAYKEYKGFSFANIPPM